MILSVFLTSGHWFEGLYSDGCPWKVRELPLTMPLAVSKATTKTQWSTKYYIHAFTGPPHPCEAQVTLCGDWDSLVLTETCCRIKSYPFFLNLPFLNLVKVKVAQSCPTLCDPMDFTVHGILQAGISEWVAFPFSRESSQPQDQTQVSCISGGFFTSCATREAQKYWNG